jgi:hypothetical protein
MTAKRESLFLGAICILCSIAGIALCLTALPGLRPHDCCPKARDITVGMPVFEVERILGPQRSSTPRNALVLDLYAGIQMYDGRVMEWWYDDCVVQVIINDEGSVVFARSLRVHRIRANSWFWSQ